MQPVDLLTEQAVNELWDKVLAALDKEASPITMTTWICPLKPVQIRNSVLYLLAPSAFHVNFTENYHQLIKNTLNTVVPAEMDINIIADLKEIENESQSPNFLPTDIEQKVLIITMKPYSNYTFDTFVVGSGNRFCPRRLCRHCRSADRFAITLCFYTADPDSVKLISCMPSETMSVAIFRIKN